MVLGSDCTNIQELPTLFLSVLRWPFSNGRSATYGWQNTNKVHLNRCGIKPPGFTQNNISILHNTSQKIRHNCIYIHIFCFYSYQRLTTCILLEYFLLFYKLYWTFYIISCLKLKKSALRTPSKVIFHYICNWNNYNLIKNTEIWFLMNKWFSVSTPPSPKK